MAELKRILHVEDDRSIQAVAKLALEAVGGFQVLSCSSGQSALDQLLGFAPDFILLDVMMPDMDGPQTLAQIARLIDINQVPVAFMTAKVQPAEIAHYRSLGARDVIIKPFDPAEVVARTKAVLRRSVNYTSGVSASVLRVDGFEIDIESHQITVNNSGNALPLLLTVTEYKLLAQLARAPKRVFSRAELLALCSPESDSLERTVDSHISKLRRKIEDLGLQGVPASIRGVGYRFGSGA